MVILLISGTRPMWFVQSLTWSTPRPWSTREAATSLWEVSRALGIFGEILKYSGIFSTCRIRLEPRVQLARRAWAGKQTTGSLLGKYYRKHSEILWKTFWNIINISSTAGPGTQSHHGRWIVQYRQTVLWEARSLRSWLWYLGWVQRKYCRKHFRKYYNEYYLIA